MKRTRVLSERATESGDYYELRCRCLARLCCRGQGGAHVEDVSLGPSAEPPGTWAALVGPIAILKVGPTPCGSLAAMVEPMAGAFATMRPESAMVVTAAKIKRFIPMLAVISISDRDNPKRNNFEVKDS